MASKNFGSGTRYLRQCHFAMTDLELHARYVPGAAGGVFAVEDKIAQGGAGTRVHFLSSA